MVWDFLSQAARREPPPRTDPEFLHQWEGLSVFDSYPAVKKLGAAIKWRRGEYIAEIHIPEAARFTYQGPDRKGHWLLYGIDGERLHEEAARFLLGCVVRVVHGTSGDE